VLKKGRKKEEKKQETRRKGETKTARSRQRYE
jgi:hypothetical protein